MGVFIGLPTLLAGLFFTRCFRTVVDDSLGLIGPATEAPKSLVAKMSIMERLSLTLNQLEKGRFFVYSLYWLFFVVFYFLVREPVSYSEQFSHLFFYRLLGWYFISFVISFILFEIGLHKVGYLSCLKNRFTATFKE